MRGGAKNKNQWSYKQHKIKNMDFLEHFSALGFLNFNADIEKLWGNENSSASKIIDMQFRLM